MLAPGLLEGTVAGFAEYTDATRGNDAAWVALCRKTLGLLLDTTAGTASDNRLVVAES